MHITDDLIYRGGAEAGLLIVQHITSGKKAMKVIVTESRVATTTDVSFAVCCRKIIVADDWVSPLIWGMRELCARCIFYEVSA